MFADDLLLASISVRDLQLMVNIVQTELDWLDMSLNVKKSVCMRIGKRFDVGTSDITLDNKPLTWVKELRYLGLYFIAATTFKCNFHYAKMSFFRSLNGILGKLGPSPPPNIVLHLVSAYCNPILFYGLDSLRLSKSNYNSISYPYNSVYSKLFSTFDKNIITMCQYYCGELPSTHAVDLQTLNFYVKLSASESNPANILFNWFGYQEAIDILNKYEMDESVAPKNFKQRIRHSFNNSCSTLM